MANDGDDDTVDFFGGETAPAPATEADDPTPQPDKPKRARKPKAEPVADPELGPQVHPDPTEPAKLDECCPGGKFVVNGRTVDCNGKPL
jgi:hypothetical protein